MKNSTFLRFSFASLVFGLLSFTGDAAKLYWVGGSGDWHNVSHWSLTSGGNGGVSIPTINDDVIFDENSFNTANESVTLSGTTECHTITWTPEVLHPIINGNSTSSLNIYGSLLLTPQLTWNYKGEINFKSASSGNAINPYGKLLAGNVNFEGSGSWQLTGSMLLSTSATLTLSSGSLVANGNAIQCGTLKIDGASQKLLDINHSLLAIKQQYDEMGAGNFHSNSTGSKIYFQHFLPMSSLQDVKIREFAHNFNPHFTPAVISVDSVIINPTCNAADTGLSCNGAIIIRGINATDNGPFSISWAGPDNISTVTIDSAFNLCPNTFSYTIYDSADNSVYGPIFVNIVAPPPLTTNYVKRNVKCSGYCDGWIITRISGETPNYTYRWSNGSSGSAVGNPSNSFYDSALCAGTYTIQITDSRGCRNSFKTNITQPLPVTVSISPTNVTCNGSCNGTATATVTGGHGSYTYSWAPGGKTTATVTGLCAGSYTLTAKDDSGCVGTGTVTITQPTAIIITTTQSNVTCNGNCNGTASVTATGGTPSYTYKWTPGGSSGSSVTGLCSGVYKIVVSDSHGCKDSANVTITQPLNLNLSVTQTNISCNGNCNGTASVTVTGGTPAYTYKWNNGATTT
ncbi:MAG TPA: SprB repeat-containing protein, partial [Bacteroidia bacterium]|nr:SprB repeat-containing protein [Bacteroidia bacterium]